MTDSMIDVTGVAVTYRGSSTPAIVGIDLVVLPSETIGIVGESGSGKTTLGRVLVGSVEPTVGAVRVAGRPWTSIRRTDPLRRSVQMIFQDPNSALNPRLTALAAVAEVFEVWDHDRPLRARHRAAELLAEVGLTADAIARRPRHLSGGQCQRVGIARALACNPSVLVADEPTSSLDVSVQAQILNLLRDLQQTRKLAIVLISHDLSVIRYLTDRAVVMHRGRIVERGSTNVLLEQPVDPYTQSLVASIPGRRGAPTASVKT